MTDTPRNILYINVSRIGDTLLATPAIRAIARHYPEAKIDVLAHPKRMEVLQHLPFVASVGATSKYRALWRGRLGIKKYDIAFVCNFDEALVNYAFRVSRKVVAFRQADEALNAKLFAIADQPPSQTEHAVQIQLRLPAAIGIPPSSLSIAYQVTPAEANWAKRFMSTAGAQSKWPLIGLQVASFPTKAYRDWPIQNFKELCEKILATYPQAHFLIFGGSLEHARTEELSDALAERATLCAGRLSLRETAALMNCIDLYVGVDTGPTHLMSALHRPMVALYHGYSPSRVLKPLEHPSLYAIDHPLADQNCSLEEPMSAIGVDQVWITVERALQERAA